MCFVNMKEGVGEERREAGENETKKTLLNSLASGMGEYRYCV